MNEVPKPTERELSPPRESAPETGGQYWGQMAERIQEFTKALDYLAMLVLQLRDSDSAELKKLIDSTYQTYTDVHDKYWKLVHKVIELKEHCHMVSGESDLAKQLREMLGRILDEQDIIPLDLERGSYYPEDKCIVKSRVVAQGLPPDTVESIITVPYVTRSGQLVKPGEIVATERQEPSVEARGVPKVENTTDNIEQRRRAKYGEYRD